MARERKRLSAKAWSEQSDSGYTPTVVKLPDGVDSFRPKKAGSYRLEIVPYEVPTNPVGGQNPNAEPGELWYERTFFVHRGIGVDENSYVCPSKTAGKTCPICEYRRELMRSKDGDEDMIKALAPKQRQLWNVYDHADADKGVQIWEVSFHLFGKQLKAAIANADEDDGWEYFADPEDGMTLRVGLGEKSFAGNTFLECETVNFKARREPLSDEILDAAQPLDNLLILLPYEKLKSIFLQEEGYDPAPEGTPSQKEVDEDFALKNDDEPPPKKRKSKPTESEKPVEKPKPKAKTAEQLGISKGDEVLYKGRGGWVVVKISADGMKLNLLDEDDEMVKDVPAEGVEKPADAEKSVEKEPEVEHPKKSKGKPAPAEDDWDADFDDEPKAEQPKKSKAKEETAAADGGDEWDF